MPMVYVLLMLIYAFAVLGMETLHDALDPLASASISNCSPYCPSFNTAANAWRTLFQLLIGAKYASSGSNHALALLLCSHQLAV